MKKTLATLLLGLLTVLNAGADEIPVAVAANFTGPMQVITPLFERETGHKLNLSFGSTGKFYAQINNGAPFEVLLTADEETPARLIKEGSAVAGSNFTYAIGKLVLWSATPGLVDDQGNILKNGGFKHLALANPKAAPYGAAGMQAMGKLGVLDSIKPLIVQGENISQTHQFIPSGAAELGFVAYSQVIRNDRIGSGSGWMVPEKLYDPIRQDAVILARGKDKAGPLALMNYLKSDKAKAIIRSFGYTLP
jgi:molybdate transport system substrate-binding protein